MAKQYGSQRKRGGTPLPLVALGILLIGLVGGGLLLHALGVVSIPLLAKDDGPKGPPPLHAGKTRTVKGETYIGVPVAARMIPVYDAVTSPDITEQGRVRVIPVLEAAAKDQRMITDIKQIIGRVMYHDKPAGYVFTEADFYPKGTRPGPTAGVPTGKRAMRLKASDIPGLHGLKLRDRFDVVMTQILEIEEEPLRAPRRTNGGLDLEGPYAKLHEAEAAGEYEAPRRRIKRQHAEVKAIVNNGVVVQPVMQRKEIGTKTSLIRGSSLTATPVEEIIIAVDPEEVSALNMALAMDAQLQVAMRSGRPDAEGTGEGEIPSIEVVVEEEQATTDSGTTKVGTTKVVEVIKGGEKRLLAVPKNDTEAPTQE